VALVVLAVVATAGGLYLWMENTKDQRAKTAVAATVKQGPEWCSKPEFPLFGRLREWL
jgi:hypothetical protein